MNDPHKHFEKYAKHIRLSGEERLHIREKLERRMLMHPLPLIVSPYKKYLRAPAFAISAIALIALSGGTAFAAENALPGEPLYGVKVNVIEPLEGSLQIGATAKASWQVHLASRRLAETEDLAEANELSSSTAALLAARVAQATTNAAIDVAALASTSPAAAASTAHLLDATVETHAHAIATLALSSDTSAAPVLTAALFADATSSPVVAVASSSGSTIRPRTVEPRPALRRVLVAGVHSLSSPSSTPLATSSKKTASSSASFRLSTSVRISASTTGSTSTAASSSAPAAYAHAAALFARVHAIASEPSAALPPVP